jgi:uncharacterized membrane protein
MFWVWMILIWVVTALLIVYMNHRAHKLSVEYWYIDGEVNGENEVALFYSPQLDEYKAMFYKKEQVMRKIGKRNKIMPVYHKWMEELNHDV